MEIVAQTTKAEIRMNQERVEAEISITRLEFQTHLKQVRPGTVRGRET
jgi:hypothetical protein